MFLRLCLLLLLVSSSAGGLAQTGSPTRQSLPSARLASPSTSGAEFSAGLSKDGNKTFVGSAATTDTVAISALVRPEPGHVGQPGSLYLVVMTAPGQFIMRNLQGAFVPWNGDVATLTPTRTVASLTREHTVDIFSGALGIEGEFGIFLAYSAADKVLHYTSTPLNLSFIVDSDGDGVADRSDLHPLNPARTMAIAPAFPRVDGILQFPDYPSTRQLKWILEQFAAGATTPTADAITARFNANALATTPVADIQAQLQTVRTTHPGSIVIEPLTVTPTSFRGLVGIPDNPGSGRFLSFTVKYATGLIDSFSLSTRYLDAPFTTEENRTLSMTQAFDKLAAITPGSASLLVARIQDNQCVPIKAHDAGSLRSTGSIFKIWVLGGLAQAVNDGVVSPTASLPLVASEVVRGSALGTEPLGTLFPLAHMATSMMGISDNTATDHVHEQVGRSRLEAIVRQFRHSAPERLTPFLSVNEQFNLYFGVTPAQAVAYRDGTEEFQRNFLNTVLVPLGPVTGSSGVNFESMFFDGSWAASPMDVCAAIASLRQFNDRSPGFKLIDQAFSSEAAIVGLRSRWERVWYKGGSLGTSAGLKVLTHAWLLESDSRGAYVVVSMHNDLGFTQDLRTKGIEWTMARVLQLVDEGSFD